MTVRVEDKVVYLTGRCQADDAETLLAALHDDPARCVDLAAAQRMHLAVVQVLLAVRPPVRGIPENDFLVRHLIDLVQ